MIKRIRLLPLLLVALVLLALLLIPNFIRCRCYGTITPCKSNLKNLGTALEMYSTDFGGKYPRNLSQLTPNYLKTIPVCPTAGRVSYRCSFGPNAPLNPEHYKDYYLVECVGGNHEAVSVTGDYPAYNGIAGLIERAP